VAEFRDQIERRIDGSLTEAEFLPLRLRNGLYLQLHAYMLRIAIPYGTLTPRKLRQLAYIVERWDRGYGHFTTRQNIQLNWPKLRDVPDILEALADVEMHSIQTSGNCVRNVTADHFAGAATDEVEDPRATAAAPAVVDRPSRVQLARPQVQDRHYRRAERPRGDPLARHRPPAPPQRGGRDRL
jgi:sulfite reductase (NADPH) hemoprotein beta-component